MSRAVATLLALLFVLTTAIPVAANDPELPKGAIASDAAGAVVPGEVIVKWRDAGRGPEVARARGLSVVAELGVPGKGLPSVLSTAGRPVNTVIAELQADPAVEYAEPNYVVTLADEGSTASVSVNDPQTGGQYSLNRMRVRDAWAHTTGGSNVVAVLDTGVQANHPDLTGRVLPGYNFVSSNTNASDDNGHGTWVAGIIAANANDGYGIAGISWSDKILPVKIMNSNGTGSTSNLTSGIVWAANNGATVINMSVGGFPYSQAVEDAVNYAWNKGAVLVGAAGNNNRREDFYPASYANVVSVSATQLDDEFSFWSSYGPKVEVSAPGSSILTTNCTASSCPNRGWGSHTHISGTSFATPNVAGVIALIKARYPSYTPSQVVSRLYSTVDDLGYPGRDERYGRGRVNALRAVGGSAAQVTHGSGDSFEGNNTLASAKLIPLGTTTRPTLYPAGDVDWFAVDVPRAGRLDVRVGGVVDSRDYPWNRSALPVDPIVELWTTGGTLLQRVDNEWESGIELAQHSVSGPTRILIRVSNYYANGSKTAYAVTPTYVDTVPPTAAMVGPSPGTTELSRFTKPVVRFDEPVTNVTSSTLRLRDTSTNALVPISVSYNSSRREATITSSSMLEAKRTYRVEATNGIRDTAGNALTPMSAQFTTGTAAFLDTVGNRFEADINWIASVGITSGCGPERYCPKGVVRRDQMASFLSRALNLPATTRDYYTDDAGNKHEANINRLAASAITSGCATNLYCPSGEVTRGQMASFLARALNLPPATRDYFVDDKGNKHEDNINRLREAGITSGCRFENSFCPNERVTREQMAAFLHRSFRNR
ncbi:MAG TPA: S8 family serine peptidase [Candidatus Limnocylindrales bacterium]|nr:S8 family serine peptidase [Candidatus Limnocylindrales bacterium]